MDTRTADLLELRRLVDAYASAVDDGDGAGMAALFVPDGRLLVYEAGSDELAYSYRGPAELANVAAEMERLYTRTFHFVGNFVCEIDGDGATGTPYCVASHLRDDGRGPQIVVMPVRYRDTYVRTPDGWRFEERICTVQWRERRLAIQWPPT
jgi:catechol 2,3-dioxygenase-like lactoylglutathione lyase family enzyme